MLTGLVQSADQESWVPCEHIAQLKRYGETFAGLHFFVCLSFFKRRLLFFTGAIRLLITFPLEFLVRACEVCDHRCHFLS